MRGAQSSPTRKDSEKFRVARADRNMPNKRSEKALMSVYCEVVGVKNRVRVTDRTCGRRRFPNANAKKVVVMAYDGLLAAGDD